MLEKHSKVPYRRKKPAMNPKTTNKKGWSTKGTTKLHTANPVAATINEVRLVKQNFRRKANGK